LSLRDGTRLIVEADGTEVGIIRHDGEWFAYENRCFHQGGPVCEGLVIGKVEALVGEGGRSLGERFSATEMRLVCPWHGWEYDLRTGRAAVDPRLCLKKYDVLERDGSVFLVVPDE
jgi:nitrite reductase/ring-hydroxylating ferredoxin subunit